MIKASQMVYESIDIYNRRKPYLSLKYQTPDERHQAFD